MVHFFALNYICHASAQLQQRAGVFFRIALNNGLVSELQQEKENPYQGSIQGVPKVRSSTL